MLVEGSLASRKTEALNFARSAYAKSHDWVAFYRQTLGVHGFAKKVFTNASEMAEFEQSEEFREIQQMVSLLRKNRQKKKDRNSHREPTKVITVRMPKSLHEVLCAQATDRGTSINNLCISKLLQLIESDEQSR